MAQKYMKTLFRGLPFHPHPLRSVKAAGCLYCFVVALDRRCVWFMSVDTVLHGATVTVRQKVCLVHECRHCVAWSYRDCQTEGVFGS